MEVAPHLKDNLNRNFFDLLGTFRQISGESVQNQLVIQRVEVPEYLTLYSPAINWILQCIAYRAPEVQSCVLSSFRCNFSSWKMENKIQVIMVLSAQLKTAVCVSISAPSDRNDGEMQDAGQQVSVFEKLTTDEKFIYGLRILCFFV